MLDIHPIPAVHETHFALEVHAATLTQWIVLPLPVSILAAFKQDYDYAMRPGWDGIPTTAALSPDVVRLAEELISQYGTTGNITEVGPGEDGSLSFVWDDRNGKYIYLDFGPKNTVHLYYDVNGEKWEGVSIASDTRILEKIARAFRRTNWQDSNRQWVVLNRSSSVAAGEYIARAIPASG